MTLSNSAFNNLKQVIAPSVLMSHVFLLFVCYVLCNCVAIQANRIVPYQMSFTELPWHHGLPCLVDFWCLISFV